MAGAHRGIHLADRSEVIYLSASIGCFTREADSTATETPEKLMATLWTPAGRQLYHSTAARNVVCTAIDGIEQVAFLQLEVRREWSRSSLRHLRYGVWSRRRII
jgi:hypothetical protein